MVVNGDAGQSDLPKGLQNGLNWSVSKLLGVDPQIGCVEFSSKHIVRNPLISKMLQHLEGPDARPMEQLSRGLNGTSRHDFYERPQQRPALA
jgi:phosphate starvation-inducible protein PhoH